MSLLCQPTTGAATRQQIDKVLFEHTRNKQLDNSMAQQLTASIVRLTLGCMLAAVAGTSTWADDSDKSDTERLFNLTTGQATGTHPIEKRDLYTPYGAGIRITRSNGSVGYLTTTNGRFVTSPHKYNVQ